MTESMTPQEYVATLPDENAVYQVLEELRAKFGFGIVCMTRADAASVWHEDEDESCALSPEITDEQWKLVQESWYWRKGWSSDLVIEAVWEIVREAVGDAKNQYNQATEEYLNSLKSR